MTKSNSTRPDDVFKSGFFFLTKQVNLHKKALATVVFFGLSASSFMIIQWVSLAYISHQIIVSKQTLSSQFEMGFVMLLAGLARITCVRLQTTKAQFVSQKIRNNIRTLLLKRWNILSPLSLQKTSPAALASQWIEDVETLDGYFSRYWPQQALALITPLLILCVIGYLNWLCALILLITAPLIPFFMILIGMGAEHINQKYSLLRQRLASHFLDRIANLSLIRLLGANDIISKEVEVRSDAYRQVIMKTLKIAFLSSTVLEFFTSIIIASLAIYIGFSLYGAIQWGPADTLTLFSGLSILLLAPEFFRPLKTLSQYYHDRAGAVGAATNISAYLDNDNEDCGYLFNKEKTGDPRILMKIRSVIFGNDSTPLVQTPVNIDIVKSSLLVISGESGSGKTTFLNTIAGYLKPISGEISLCVDRDGTIAFLPQRAWIKNDTIRANIRAVAATASDNEIITVLKSLNLYNELIDVEKGLETVIGEHGQGLSGGQMQRIALARILLAPTPIVLLDEPTASLDLASRKIVIDALQSLKHHSSSAIIIATHDPMLVSIADAHLHLSYRENH